MLPAVSLLGNNPCPYVEAGLCDRPHCNFSHEKRDTDFKPSLATASTNNAANDEGGHSSTEKQKGQPVLVTESHKITKGASAVEPVKLATNGAGIPPRSTLSVKRNPDGSMRFIYPNDTRADKAKTSTPVAVKRKQSEGTGGEYPKRRRSDSTGVQPQPRTSGFYFGHFTINRKHSEVAIPVEPKRPKLNCFVPSPRVPADPSCYPHSAMEKLKSYAQQLYIEESFLKLKDPDTAHEVEDDALDVIFNNTKEDRALFNAQYEASLNDKVEPSSHHRKSSKSKRGSEKSSGSGRVSHYGAEQKPISVSLQRKPILHPAETMRRRCETILEKNVDKPASASSTTTSSSATASSTTTNSSATASSTTTSSSATASETDLQMAKGRKRISHVANVTGLLNPKLPASSPGIASQTYAKNEKTPIPSVPTSKC